MRRVRKFYKKKLMFLLQFFRILTYRILSCNTPRLDHSKRLQPVMIEGNGEIFLGHCRLGYWPSPYFLTGSIYIEARASTAEVYISDGVCINNNAVIIAESTRIYIGKGSIIGTDLTIYDSDFHNLNPLLRHSGIASSARVEIGENVFIGSKVTILKGVKIGNNAVIACGSLITKSIPANTLAGGVPAKIISRHLP